MNFRETTQEDLEYTANHSISRGIQKQCPEQTDYCFTLEHKGLPLGVGGVRFINLTTAWCWVDLTDISGNHIIVVYRTIKEWLNIFAKEHGIKRLQAYIECDFPEAIRMAEHLGFKKESTMKNFLSDGDAIMFVRII